MINVMELKSKKTKDLPIRPTKKYASFTEKSEAALIKELFEKEETKKDENEEESPYYDGIVEVHKKRTNGL